MTFYLSALAKKAGYKLDSYASVNSTNDLGLEVIKACAPNIRQQNYNEKHWITAQTQTQGRGRRGNEWISPKGNLYCSLALSNIINIEDCVAFSYIAGISLKDAIEHFKSIYQPSIELDLSLKWPNDILLNGKKLSGILLEIIKLSNESYGVVIGIGVNVLKKIDHLDYATTCLAEHGIDCDPAMLLERLSYYWVENYALYKNTNGKERILNTWLAYTSCIGKTITIKLQNHTISGIFETLDKNFACVVRLLDGSLVKVNSGDVLFSNMIL